MKQHVQDTSCIECSEVAADACLIEKRPLPGSRLTN
jgi:hypothetical protein